MTGYTVATGRAGRAVADGAGGGVGPDVAAVVIDAASSVGASGGSARGGGADDGGGSGTATTGGLAAASATGWTMITVGGSLFAAHPSDSETEIALTSAVA